MLKLNLSNKPAWLDLGHGVRVRLLPLTTALMVAARNDQTIADLPQDATDEQSALVFAKALGRLAITGWEGVGDEDGQPVDVSPEGIDALLDVWPLFEAFQTEYVAGGLLLDQEKNVSSPLPGGSSAGATGIAEPAKANARTARKP
ncbi:hypothetical protein [Profundibacter sp.]|uniref:hypothetical protein n=1 Tax=Profundibacter sp. TaxID=3101071 RepID=UPI003D0A95AC